MGWRVALVQFGVQVVVAQASFGLDPVSSHVFQFLTWILVLQMVG
jgi:hypothetical protein